MGTSLQIPATLGDPQGVPPEEPHTSHASHPRDAARDVPLAGPPRARPPGMLPLILEKKREDTGGLSFPHTTWEPEQGELALDQGEGVTVAEVFPECSAASIQVQAEGIGTLPGAEGGRVTQGTPEGEAERGPVQRLLVSDPRGSAEQATSGSKQKREGLREEEAGVLPRWAAQEDSTAEKEPEQIEVTSVAWRAAQPEESLHAVVQVRTSTLSHLSAFPSHCCHPVCATGTHFESQTLLRSAQFPPLHTAPYLAHFNSQCFLPGSCGPWDLKSLPSSSSGPSLVLEIHIHGPSRSVPCF